MGLRQRCAVLVFALLFLMVGIRAHSKWVEKRVVPVQISACGSEENFTPEKLFDAKRGVDDKWCCFHAGYNSPQTHWVNIDLGKVYPLVQCVIYHEGFRAGDQAHYNTEDFSISGGETALQGPWTLISNITDNLQPFNVIAGNNVKVRYLRLEVTDTQSLNNPLTPNTDHAVRILEWEITVWDYEPDSPGQAITSAPPETEPAARGGSGSSPVTARPLLYFFYLNEHQRSREFYNSVILKRENWPIVTRYTVIPVDMNADRSKVREMGVYKSPTSVVATPDGRKVADLPGVLDEQEFLKFLRDNLR